MSGRMDEDPVAEIHIFHAHVHTWLALGAIIA